MPVTARCTLANVNSSAITARHPDVPNLICVSIFDLILWRRVLSSLSTSRKPMAES